MKGLRTCFAESSPVVVVDLVSDMTEADSASVSLLIFLLGRLPSSLGARKSPIRPSFSIATKLVLTFDSGLGEPENEAPVTKGSC